MNLYGIKCLMFTKNKNTKIKLKIDGERLLINRGFRKLKTIDEEELSYLLESLI